MAQGAAVSQVTWEATMRASGLRQGVWVSFLVQGSRDILMKEKPDTSEANLLPASVVWLLGLGRGWCVCVCKG